VAQYAGDGNFLGSTGSLRQTTVRSGTARLNIESRTATVECFGWPNTSYELRRSTNLAGAWATLTITNATASGIFQWVDDFDDLGNVPPEAFYWFQEH
jgi:hypothetical protein